MTIETLSQMVSDLATRVKGLEDQVHELETNNKLITQRQENLEKTLEGIQDTLSKISGDINNISTTIAVMASKKEENPNVKDNNTFQKFLIDIGTYLIKAGILGGLAAYIFNKGGF